MASSGTQETKPEILSTYADQFRRIGALPGEYEIKIEHYPLKMVEEVAASMSEAKVFSALDATSGFYEIKLAEESTWLTTFNTLFGRFKFERLPFGLVSAPEVFQRVVSDMLEAIEKCEVIVEDLLVWGKNTEDHDHALKQVLKRAAENDLRFNEQKCKFFKDRKLNMWDMFLELMA